MSCDPKDSASNSSLTNKLPSHLFLFDWFNHCSRFSQCVLCVIPPVLWDVILLTTPAHYPPTKHPDLTNTPYPHPTTYSWGERSLLCLLPFFPSMKAERGNEKERANPASVVTTVRGGWRVEEEEERWGGLWLVYPLPEELQVSWGN